MTKNIELEAISWFKDWADKGNFKELFSYDNFSLWWLMENWLYNSYVYKDSVRDVIMAVEKTLTVIEKEKPEEFIFVDSGDLYSKAVKLVCKEKGIKIRRIKQHNPFKNLKKDANLFLIKNYIEFYINLRRALWMLGGRKTKESGNILFISTDTWAKKEDPYIDPIIEELDKNPKNKVVVCDLSFNYKLNFRNLLEKLKKRNRFFIEGYLNKDVKKRVNKLTRLFKKRWDLIKNKKEFQNSFEYRGINMWELVEPQFSCYFDVRLKGHIRDLELLKEVVKETKPKIAISPGETSEISKALFYACKLNGAYSVGIQHGIIEDSIRCIHKECEIGEGLNPNYCPLPDKTLVFGENQKRFLVEKGCYPESKIEVTGSQRWDVLASADKLYNKQRIYKTLKIGEGKKIVVFTSQPVSNEENLKILKALLKTFEKFPELTLVIKIHPVENTGFYRKIAKDRAIVVKNIDLYELLYASELMITYYSTTGLEAMILGRPVIVINLSGQPDKVNYVREGAAIGVYKEEDLAKAVGDTITNEKVKEKLKTQMEKFVYKSCYKTDGKAARRIADVIEKMSL